MFYSTAFAYGLGAMLAAAMIDATRQMPARGAWNLLSWLMAIVVAGFVAFPIERGNVTSLAYEAGLLVVLEILLIVGWRWRSWSLVALVYFVHGLSDLVHLTDIVPMESPRWVHEMCVPFDWILAGWIVVRRRAFAAAALRDTAGLGG